MNSKRSQSHGQVFRTRRHRSVVLGATATATPTAATTTPTTPTTTTPSITAADTADTADTAATTTTAAAATANNNDSLALKLRRRGRRWHVPPREHKPREQQPAAYRNGTAGGVPEY